MILNDLKKPELILSSTDKTVLMEFIQLLELFEEATIDAQGENHATISCVAPCILSIVHSLNSKKCDHLENMRVSLLSSMKARFSGLLRQFAIDVPNDQYVMAERFADPIFLLTPTLDARFKFHWLNDIGLLDDIKRNIVEKIKKLISLVDSQDTRRDIEKETLTDTNKEQQTSDAAYSPVCGKRKLSKLFPYLENPSKRILNIKSTVSEELENFGKEQRMDNDLILTKHQSYPHLSKLALKYFTVPATSAPIERIFSQSGFIIRPHRSKLSASTLCVLTFLKCNNDLLE
ncbi:unnamed protein product [Didymodactylos carnosus]|uniref:HAT C-terminal dimerisation domain-containing protein n=1 Tax=Didymodactylos carnosus TaxID=1234261 RepID=A0A8S2V1T6_9BILA|nr:unnamed protein product [Didymodactylos carnosus]